MNAVVGSEHIKALQEQFKIISSGQNSVPIDNPTRCIDYVFHYKNSKPVTVTGTATLTRFRKGDPTKASDHLPVYADVKF
jgi:endonuclease/exonuclease/phosphatase family metal-dependent hydrolase